MGKRSGGRVDSGHEPPVTITTVLYNSQESLARYASALETVVSQGRATVLVVDNASPDDSASHLARLLPRAEIIRNEVNVGFAAGCNVAWPRVRTRYWLLLNPDVEIDAEGLDRLVEWMDRHSSVGVASPLLRAEDGRALAVARPHDSLWRPFVELLRLHKLIPDRFRSRLLLSGRRSTPATINGWVPGTALIARSEAVAAVGLLDEDLFLYGEDREWCWRMACRGWKVGVCTDAEFVHVGSTSAVATWSHAERIRREVIGHLRVTQQIHRRAWTRMFALCIGVSLMLTSVDPRGERTTRDDARHRGSLYLHSAWTGTV